MTENLSCRHCHMVGEPGDEANQTQAVDYISCMSSSRGGGGGGGGGATHHPPVRGGCVNLILVVVRAKKKVHNKF